ncbi:MAG: sensor domain-containing diguanylate cyclase [Betaproteobacteria bacterium]
MNNPLQSENFSLRQQLEVLLHEAQRNEDKMRRFDRLERRLIGAGSLVELVGLLLSEYKLAFAVEHVTLTLVDRDYEVTRILETGLGKEITFAGLKLFQSPDLLENLYGEMRDPWLGDFSEQQHQALFDTPSGEVSSVALLPLSRQGELIGSLNFGSASAERYAGTYATDFLERLAGVVAICIESSLSQERLKQLGLTDQLTGVQNRRYFEHRCSVEVSQATRYKHPLACMFLDVDKFKRINDTYGHQTGDEVLRGVANEIQAQLRSGDTIARYGGEEFVVLLPQSELHHALQIAERIRVSIENKPFQALSGHAIKMTISIGLSMLPAKAAATAPHEMAARLVAAADKALYRAKHTGRNRVECEGGSSLEDSRWAFWGRAFMTRFNSLLEASGLKRTGRAKA